MVYNVRVTLKYRSEWGLNEEYTFSKEVENLDELKEAFLKRFGNINASTKSMKVKPIIKKLTYKAKTVKEWVDSINNHPCIQGYWNIKVDTKLATALKSKMEVL